MLISSECWKISDFQKGRKKRNLPHDWVEQKGKEREVGKKEFRTRPTLLRSICIRGKESAPWEAPDWQGNQLGWRRCLKASEKSTATGLRKEKQRAAQMISATAQHTTA